MKKYRKKPLIIDAIQYDGTNHLEIQAETGAHAVDVHYEAPGAPEDMQPILSIRTLEGTMTVSKGDWVIRGIAGEFYPCKPDIFEATYVLADQEVSV